MTHFYLFINLFQVYHSMYLKYLPKRTHFGYDVMIHASMLAALDHNNNANRGQVVSLFISFVSLDIMQNIGSLAEPPF